jgi:hypothetical protein
MLKRVVVPIVFALLLPVVVPFAQETPKSTPAAKETGEPEGDAFHFMPMPVDQRVYQMNDPMLSNLARKIEDGSANLIERRAWWWLEQRLYPFDKPVPSDWRVKAQASIKEMERTRPLQADGAPLATLKWTQIGPSSYYDGSDVNSGRATALWVDPTNANTILLGTADGGIWKTTDQGSTWTSIFDVAASLSIGAIGVDPNNKQVIYAGTGEGNFNLDGINGLGIYKSTDGGANWALLPWPSGYTSSSIRRIVVDPRNSNTVYAASNTGVFYSGDAGASWSRTTCGATSNYYYVTDIVLDSVTPAAGNPSIVYAAIGSVWSTYNGSNGIYRSTAGGAGPWTMISTGAVFPAISGVGRITLLLAPSDPKQMYALLQSISTSGSKGIFYTADATAATVTWVAKSTTNFCSSQCWYDMTGVVDPTNPAHLIVGGLDVYVSSNTGGALTKISSWDGSGSGFSHADHHHMVMPNSTTLYDANDGGFFIGTINWSTPSNSTWVNKNTGLSTLQFYGFAQHPTDATKVQGGLQDNGQAYFNGTTWNEVAGGDGGCTAWDQSNGSYAYEEYVYAAIARNSNMTGSPSSWSCIQNFGSVSGCGGSIPDGRCAFIAPFVLDANNQNTMYTGSYKFYRNTAPRTGSTWTVATTPTDFTGGSGYITAIHSAKNNGTSGYIYAGTSDGKIWLSTDGGANFTQKNTGLASVRSITTDPANYQNVLATVSGFAAAHVYRSTNGGTTWADITGSLPPQPFNTIILDPADANIAYAGSDFGVFESTNVWAATPAWTSITSNLPAVSIQQLGCVSGGKLRAATHGRGVWELTVATSTPKEASPSHDMTATRGSGTAVNVAYTAACGATDNTVYAGDLSTLQTNGISWTSRYCNKLNTGSLSFDPGAANVYFVVVANNGSVEGSYGQGTSGERPAAGAGVPCAYTQNLAGTCP